MITDRQAELLPRLFGLDAVGLDNNLSVDSRVEDSGHKV